jgi:hypothetical protein
MGIKCVDKTQMFAFSNFCGPFWGLIGWISDSNLTELFKGGVSNETFCAAEEGYAKDQKVDEGDGKFEEEGG